MPWLNKRWNFIGRVDPSGTGYQIEKTTPLTCRSLIGLLADSFQAATLASIVDEAGAMFLVAYRAMSVSRPYGCLWVKQTLQPETQFQSTRREWLLPGNADYRKTVDRYVFDPGKVP